ncbi:MAG: hypothetical protein AAF363_08720 [Bacteroidota bacterium]
MWKSVFVIILLFWTINGFSQSLSDSLKLELLEFERQLVEDSAFFVTLAESINDLDKLYSSQLTLRLSYSTDVSSAGRDFNINQNGFIPTISYYHKSGVFAEVSGNIYSDLEPSYSFTTVTTGYSGFIGEKWSYLISYDHFFYNESSSESVVPRIDSLSFEVPEFNDLTNSINLSTYYEWKPFTLGIDYSFLFGSNTANRLIPSISAEIQLPKLWLFDKITFLPSVAMITGNQTVVDQFFNRESFADETRSVTENLTRNERLDFIAEVIGVDEITFLEFFRNFNPEERRSILGRATTLAAFQLVDPFLFFETIEENNFTVLNYSLAAPLSFRKGDLDFLASYIYNFPQELEGEPETPSYGYFRFSLGYSFGL